jgi:hypothetical protein
MRDAFAKNTLAAYPASHCCKLLQVAARVELLQVLQVDNHESRHLSIAGISSDWLQQVGAPGGARVQYEHSARPSSTLQRRSANLVAELRSQVLTAKCKGSERMCQ